MQQEAGVVKMTERLSLFSSTEDHSLCQLGHLLKAVSSFIPKDDSLRTQIGPLGNGNELGRWTYWSLGENPTNAELSKKGGCISITFEELQIYPENRSRVLITYI